MATSLRAAIQTVRLTGDEPNADAQFGMARRLMIAAANWEATRLALTETALDGTWK
jgi:hypothetical protein